MDDRAAVSHEWAPNTMMSTRTKRVNASADRTKAGEGGFLLPTTTQTYFGPQTQTSEMLAEAP